MPLSPLLRPSTFAGLPGWADDAGIADGFAAFRRSARHALDRPHRTGGLGIDAATFRDAFAEARDMAAPDAGMARAFFERHFKPFEIAGPGFVTGFYEPETDGSLERSERFTVPLLGVPDDLVRIDDANRPEGMDPYLAFGRRTEDGPVEYFDRAAIERGAIEGRAKPIAWLADRVDAFFIHVQGAARLRLPDGSSLRVTYAAKSGQRFTGPGHVLAGMGEIPREAVTMQSIRAWLRAHPERIDEILHRNRSYIFFRETPAGDDALGPIAAARVQLTPGRSLAVDRLLHTFATPFFVDAPELAPVAGAPVARLMVAQDTGSAIVGPARADLFIGSGDAAGEIAGVIRHPARLFALVPRALSEAA